MEEARRVLERLRRIELLEQEGAGPGHLLGEVRALLAEAEDWARIEKDESADDAVERCRAALTSGQARSQRSREQEVAMAGAAPANPDA